MTKVHWTSVVSGIALALGSVAAGAAGNGSWHYDAEFDTIVLDVPGSRDNYPRGSSSDRPQKMPAQPDLKWDYDADGDTIVLNVPGSRNKYRSAAQRNTAQRADAVPHTGWYYDPEFDTIVLNVPGSRARYITN